jgi:hypothetical protein
MNSRQTDCAIALAAVTLTLAVTTTASEAVPAVAYPANYRSWQHVRTIVVGPDHPSFANRGGIHHYYANAKAVEGYRTGKFPNGSVIVDEGLFTKSGEDRTKGITFEGDRRTLDVMAKNDEIYKDTGGWGFEHFDGAAPTPTLGAERRGQCFQCHSKGAERDAVFSSIRP